MSSNREQADIFFHYPSKFPNYRSTFLRVNDYSPLNYTNFIVLQTVFYIIFDQA